MRKPLSSEQLKVWTDQLESGITELYNSRQYAEYLGAMSKFHKYSFGNVLLIMRQFPDAQLVAGYHTWRKEFGRQVKRYEKGITILAPCPYKRKAAPPQTEEQGESAEEAKTIIRRFRTETVFDVSQTVGKELPVLGVEELTGTVVGYNTLVSSLKTLSPFTVEYDDLPKGENGFCDYGSRGIVLRKDMSQVQTVKTLVHEIAHAKLHALPSEDGAVLGQHKKTKSAREVEAESVAYVVCQYLGLDTSEYSFGYIAEWGSGKKLPELKASLACIRNTAAELIGGIERLCLNREAVEIAANEKSGPRPARIQAVR